MILKANCLLPLLMDKCNKLVILIWQRSSVVMKFNTLTSIFASRNRSLYCGKPISSNQETIQCDSKFIRNFSGPWHSGFLALSARKSFLRCRLFLTPSLMSKSLIDMSKSWLAFLHNFLISEEYPVNPKCSIHAQTESTSHSRNGTLGSLNWFPNCPLLLLLLIQEESLDPKKVLEKKSR